MAPNKHHHQHMQDSIKILKCQLFPSFSRNRKLSNQAPRDRQGRISSSNHTTPETKGRSSSAKWAQRFLHLECLNRKHPQLSHQRHQQHG